MKRILPLIFMGFLASLFGCGRPVGQPSAPPPAQDISAVDLVHESGGIFYHGTLTLIDGKVGATWTVDDGKGKKSQDVLMTESAFRSIWDSVTNIPDFNAGAVTDPNQKLDPALGYMIGVISSVGGQQKMQAYMIPSATMSSAFRE
jgi:hypothetical protein